MIKRDLLSLSREESLILACSHLELTPELERDLRRLLNSPLDWELLVKRAEIEGVAPLLYHNLKDKGIPQKVVDTLKALYWRTKRTNEFTLQAFAEIGEIFAKKGVDFILLQGIALIGTLYPDPGLRPIGDVDLLIREGDMDRVVSIIAELGFERVGRYTHLFSDGELLLDIHQELGNVSRIKARRFVFSFDINEIWEKARTKEGPFPYALYLSPEDEFLYLASHLQRHSFSRLIWFVDLSELIRLSNLDLDVLRKLAGRLNLDRSLLFSLGFIKTHLNPNISEDLIHSLTKPPLNLLEEIGYRKLLSFAPLPYFGDLLFLLSIKGFRNRFRFALETAFPRPEIMREMVPLYSRLSFLAYPLRLMKIFFMMLNLCANLLKKKVRLT